MKKSPQVTIADLAKELGLGKATVSLALRDDARIRNETRLRVKKLAELRGYQTNPMVAHVMSQLRSARVSNYRATLALVNLAPRQEDLLSNTTFHAIRDGFRARAVELGYSIDDFWLGDPIYRESEKLKSVLRARRIEGVALLAMNEKDHLPKEILTILPDCVLVGLGVRLVQPLIHCCCNNQYGTILNAARRVLESGQRRLGLVLQSQNDQLLNGKFSMGFRYALEEAGDRPEVAAGKVWSFQAGDSEGFFRWHESLRPEWILTNRTEIADWLKQGPAAAKKTALAHLDLDGSMAGWAGMNQHNDLVGAYGVDLLTAHLARRDIGLPRSAKTMLVESEWVDGLSMRPEEFLD
ncbi:MAG: LacI family transcriptional regulator [Verrucomicrobia bacterium]|nr:LacI family transcriptional regulator [Verrucomicrobiota bacterium]